MLPELETALELLSEMHGVMVDTLSKAGPEAANWKPGPEYNSLWVNAYHSAESQRWWIRENLAGIDIQRNRPAEFTASGSDPAWMAALFAEVDELTRTTLSALYPEDLLETRKVRDNIRTKRYMVQHVVRHTALHLGHMEITWQWWQDRAAK